MTIRKIILRQIKDAVKTMKENESGLDTAHFAYNNPMLPVAPFCQKEDDYLTVPEM